MAFRIEATLSEGHSTIVARAFDETLHRTVLLKVLRPALAGDAAVRERFVREARAVAALRCEQIVQVYDLTEHEGAPAIVMEYVEGRSLKEVFEQEGDFGEPLAKRVATDVLKALAAAHAKGIAHRDIKPGNILVMPNGSMKVTDFGLAQVTSASTVTAEGAIIGTPAYLSPEAVRGERTDIRSDLFSLGATLVEALTGERIFDGASYAQCLSKIAAFRITMLDRFADRVSPEFLQILMRMMEPDPARRCGSADEALASIAGRSPASASVPAKPDPWKRRAAFVAVLVLVAAGAFMLSMREASSPSVASEAGGMQQVPSKGQPETAARVERDLPVRSIPAFTQGGTSNERIGRTGEGRSPNVSSAPDSGAVRITSTPWAQIYIDDRLIGETPIHDPVSLPVGSHTVVFTHPTLGSIVRTVNVPAGREIVVAGDLLERTGYLLCTVTPWAEVYVDETYRDTTPLRGPIALPAGTHRVRLHHTAFPDVVREVVIAGRDTVVLNHTFAP